MPDDHRNFAYSTVATAPSPATTGTSVTVAAGTGSRFPEPPFNVVIWPTGQLPLSSNAEIVRVTAIASDVLTIVRGQEGTTARTVVVGDQIAAAITTQMIRDAEAVSIPAKLYFVGHSYGGAQNADPYQNWENGTVFGGENFNAHAAWTQVVVDLLGMSQHVRYIEAPVPAVAAGSDATTILGVLAEESLLEGLWYVPVSPVTGANTNSRTLQLRSHTNFAASYLANHQLTSGVNLAAWSDVTSRPIGVNRIIQPTAVSLNTPGLALRDSGNQLLAACAMSEKVLGGTAVHASGTVYAWTSLHVGTGLADPGGLVIMRVGGRIRNACVGGGLLMRSGVYAGGWTTAMSWRHGRRLPGCEINVVSAVTAGSGKTISCDPLPWTLSIGATITFSGGATATVTGGGGTVGANSFTADVTAPGIAAGEQGYTGSATLGYESILPQAINVMGYGINDAGIQSTLDQSAFRESLRAVAAWLACPYISGDVSAVNITYAAGNGASAAWVNTDTGRVTAGSAPAHFPAGGFAKLFTGAIGGTKPTITIKIAPGVMQGTVVDVFFAAMVGATRGASATITVDGSTPPGGSCVVDTRGIATGFTVDEISMTATTTNGSATITKTAGTDFTNPGDIGKYVTGPGIAKGTFIKAVTSTTVATLSQNAGAGAGSGAVKLIPFVPMVKRITGLTRETAHSILITLDNISATDGTAGLFFLGYGIEGDNPVTPVLIHDVPRVPNTNISGYGATNPDSNVQTLNTEIAAVVAGTASTVGLNTTERALPEGVTVVPINAELNRDPENYSIDGLHPNSRGMSLIAAKTVEYIKQIQSLLQLTSR